MAERINIPITRAAAVALSHWLSAVPVEDLPVTDPSERQALADLLTQLELTVGDVDGGQVAEAQRVLLKDAGEWVYRGVTYEAKS